MHFRVGLASSTHNTARSSGGQKFGDSNNYAAHVPPNGINASKLNKNAKVPAALHW
jgi:hypothetical protein